MKLNLLNYWSKSLLNSQLGDIFLYAFMILGDIETDMVFMRGAGKVFPLLAKGLFNQICNFDGKTGNLSGR